MRIKLLAILLTVALVVPAFSSSVFAESGHIVSDETNPIFVWIRNTYDLDNSGILSFEEGALVTEVVIPDSLNDVLTDSYFNSFYSYFPNLKKIDISDCSKLKWVNLRSFEKLEELDAHNCVSIVSIQGNCPTLKKLNVCGDTSIYPISFSYFPNLTSFNIADSNIHSINFSNCPSLLNTYFGIENVDSMFGKDYLRYQLGDDWVVINTDTRITGIDTTYVRINNTNFPDSAFRNYINSTFNTDSNGVFSSEELSRITQITIPDSIKNSITSLQGIKYFTSLSRLDCNQCTNLTSLDISGMKNINTVIAYGCTSVNSVRVDRCSNLEYLDVCGAAISGIYLNSCHNLRWLNIAITGVSLVDFSLCPKLVNAFSAPGVGEHYVDHTNGSNTIVINEATRILSEQDDIPINEYFFPDSHFRFGLTCNATVNGNSVMVDVNRDGVLSYSERTNAKSYYYTNTNFETDDLMVSTSGLEYLPNIETFSVSHTRLSEVDVSHNPCLRVISVWGAENNISTIDISNNPSLVSIYCLSFQTLDITNNPILIELFDNVEPRRITSRDEILVEYSSDDYEGFIYTTANCNITYTRTPSPTPTTTPPSPTPTTTLPSTNPTTVPGNSNSSRPTGTTTAPNSVPSGNNSESGVGGFVERLYTIALNRPSDPNGKADWINRVYTQGATGADVARGFLFSPEFLGKDMTNEDFLDVLYRVFFDRAGDQGGINYWLENMVNGMDKQTVILGFINSTEWANVCLRFGITSGGNGVPNITIEPSSEIIAFATRLYTTCLGRNADQGGLNDWSHRIANRQISGSEAAYGFFFSVEFINDSSIDNAEYINRLYLTFMNRPADTAGFNDWMNRMNGGASREDVFAGFAGSQEWAGICSSYGILK